MAALSVPSNSTGLSLNRIVAWLAASFLLLPILVVIPISLTPESYLSLPSTSISFRHYGSLATDGRWTKSIVDSLIVGIGATVLATVLGVAFAVGAWRLGAPLARRLRLLLLAPIIVPPIVHAVAFYRAWATLGLLDHEQHRRKDEFLAMLAHELRNPLAPIRAAADLLAIANLGEERIRQTSAVISRQVQHMSSLVDDLLDISRVTRGLIELAGTDLDIKRVVADAVEQVRPLVEARLHELTVISPAEPAHVMGDHKRLVQILANILNNAVKYTQRGGRIRVKTETTDEHVLLSVEDNGAGVPLALQPYVFELFSQAARSSDRAQGGLGIGLALVKSLVGLHGGQVTCHSDGPGAGSRFTVTLPRMKADPMAGDQMAPKQ